jgi:hypothetical protein
MKTIRYIIGIHILFFYLLIFSLSLSENLLAQKKTYNWEVHLSVGTMYDNNILKYSDKYIQRFLNREDEGRFHIDRYDDVIFPYTLGITYSNKIFGNLNTIVGAGYNSNAYSYNGIKNWGQYNIHWRQYVTKSTSFRLSYSYIPKFYVRHFRDDDWTDRFGYTPKTFKPYEFSKDNFSAWFQHYFFWKTTRIRLYFSYMRYYHNEHYTEYDSDNYLYGFRVYQLLAKKLKVNAGYRYITSAAKAIDDVNDFDEIDFARRSDATYNEHIYLAGIEFKFPKIFDLNNDISITGQYQRRFYTTDHFYELDPLHAGRHDYNYRVYSRYNLYIFSYLSVTPFFNWIFRNTDTSAEENQEYLSDEKDYSQYQLGIKVNYKFRF